MNQKTKRQWLIGGSIIVVIGVIYYLSKKSTQGDDVIDPQGAPKPVDYSLDTTEKVMAFQDWMDNQGPWVKGKDGKYRLLNKGAGYGNFGPSTKAAWDYYKINYITSLPKF